ncbi:L-rhamnose mutarotase [Brevibacterium sp. RIT 803]|uniref:L-rhamnose mutarotase n=1 Tax=Brevibacterium sp. RIT 803 TaxID=2810210 RepID=UPI0019520B5E|nr:L-rhamnose mutarotase [Brevibacterium sp. RIT 803]MBM6589610.1 L-rhamnose mutarotase [Brevibacterium sp. RIT 803]
MERVCFRMQVDPAHLGEYIERHRSVWPEMLTALQNSGWNNYSLFADPNGMIIGYLETEDYETAQRDMELKDINAKWQASMSEHFASGRSFDDGPARLQEVFNLEDQLSARTP